MGQEIERKFLVDITTAMDFLDKCNRGEYKCHEIEQAYLTTNPVIRVRRSDDEYYMTYKGEGIIAKEEYNLPLTKDAYDTLKGKADGNVICKKRILIPYEKYTIELDIFDEPFNGLIFAEVEFDTLDEANNFTPPNWFLEDVTHDRNYSNSVLSRKDINDIKTKI